MYTYIYIYIYIRLGSNYMATIQGVIEFDRP